MTNTQKRVMCAFRRTGSATIKQMRQSTPHYFPALKSLIEQGLVQAITGFEYCLTKEGGSAMPEALEEFPEEFPVEKDSFDRIRPGCVVEYLNGDGDPKHAVIFESVAGHYYGAITFNGQKVNLGRGYAVPAQLAGHIRFLIANSLDEYLFSDNS